MIFRYFEQKNICRQSHIHNDGGVDPSSLWLLDRIAYIIISKTKATINHCIQKMILNKIQYLY